MPNERGRIHEQKDPFRKQLSAQAFKVYSFVSERRVQNQHMVTVLGGFIFKCATHGIHCSSDGGYQRVLHCCVRPLLDWGELPVFVVRPYAPNRDARTVTVRYELGLSK